jgi:hypothetical protein
MTDRRRASAREVFHFFKHVLGTRAVGFLTILISSFLDIGIDRSGTGGSRRTSPLDRLWKVALEMQHAGYLECRHTTGISIIRVSLNLIRSMRCSCRRHCASPGEFYSPDANPKTIIKSEIDLHARLPCATMALRSRSAVKIYGRAARPDFRDLIKAGRIKGALWART